MQKESVLRDCTNAPLARLKENQWFWRSEEQVISYEVKNVTLESLVTVASNVPILAGANGAVKAGTTRS
jgi:hypothetical protein